MLSLTPEELRPYNLPIEYNQVLLAIFNDKPVSQLKNKKELKLKLGEIITNVYNDRGCLIGNEEWLFKRIMDDIEIYFFDLSLSEIAQALHLGVRRVYFNLSFANSMNTMSPDIIHEILHYYKKTYRNKVLATYNGKIRAVIKTEQKTEVTEKDIKDFKNQYIRSSIEEINDYILGQRASHNVMDIKNEIYDYFEKYDLIPKDDYKKEQFQSEEKKKSTNQTQIAAMIGLSVMDTGNKSSAKRKCLKFYIEKWKEEKFDLIVYFHNLRKTIIERKKIME